MFSKFMIPQMFAQVSQKKMTAQEAVNASRPRDPRHLHEVAQARKN
jgi:hypothetical protein